MKPYVLVILILVAACSPQNIQNWFVTTAPDGSLIHHFTGYTNLGETQPGSARKYLEVSLQSQCGGQAKIIRIDEWPFHNAFGEFLGWAGEGQCI